MTLLDMEHARGIREADREVREAEHDRIVIIHQLAELVVSFEDTPKRDALLFALFCAHRTHYTPVLGPLFPEHTFEEGAA